MKKIGEIKGVPVVEGNINEVTKNQIHYKEDSGSIQLSKRGNDNKLNSVTSSSSGGSSIKYIPKYYRFVENTPYDFTQLAALYSSSAKINRNGDISITFSTEVLADADKIKMLGFSFNPLHTEIAETKMYVDSFEEFSDNGGISEIKQYIERITEEEYYKID
jgi:hypothetical protein